MRSGITDTTMTTPLMVTSIIPDDAGASAAEGDHEREREGGQDFLRQTADLRAVHRVTIPSPAAETGLITAVSVVGEEAENDATQDASRVENEAELIGLAGEPVGVVDRPNDSADRLDGKVLIVEDYPEVADVINVILQRMGFTTAVESHGLRAFERFNQMHPHIVMLDLALPDVTGWRVLDAIKERHGAGYHMPVVIVMTAYGDPANRLVGKLQGVHAYLIKPFTAEELQKVVREAHKHIS